MLSGLCLFAAASARAQAPPPAASCQPTPTPIAVKADSPPAAGANAGGIRLFLFGADKKPLARKRFYLLRRSAFASGIDWASMPKRADSQQGASPQLREWLARHDCDTLYCPEYEAEFESAKESVPEFKRAYADGLRKYKNPKTALRWITVSFPLKNLRTGFYERKKLWTEASARRAGLVASVMTDERGEAYFTGVGLKDFYVSNVFPLERGNVLWSAHVRVPPLLPGKLHSVTVELLAPPQPTPAPTTTPAPSATPAPSTTPAPTPAPTPRRHERAD